MQNGWRNTTNSLSKRKPTGDQRYRHLFEHAPVCIFVIDLRANPITILEGNRRAELVYGYSAAEMMGMPAIQLAPAMAMPAMLEIEQQVQMGRLTTTETTHQQRDGARFPVRIVAVPDPTDSGHMIITVEDITAERQRRSEAEAIDAERRRIAHEIHDGVAQNLAGLRFKLALWSNLNDDAPPGMRAALDELLLVLTAAIKDLRRAIFALRPVDLELLGFFPALTQLVGGFGDHNHLATRMEVSGEPIALPAAYELPLFRIIQEALNNVDQHAYASFVLVRFAMDPNGCVAVSVRDNGCGFDLSQLGPVDHGGHFGLRQMRERILDLGGTLSIVTAPGQGTELAISLPGNPREVFYAAD